MMVYGNDVATATYYYCYLDSVTGVGAAQFKMKQKCATTEVPQFFIQNVPPGWGKVFVALTAFNVGDEESAESTESTIAGIQITS